MSPLTAVTLLVTLNNTLAPATTSIVPVDPVVRSAPAVNSTSPLAKTLMLPLTLRTSALAVMLVLEPLLISATEPEPSALTPTPAVPAVPSVMIRFPPKMMTIEPLFEVVLTSLCTMSSKELGLPLDRIRLTVTPTSPMMRSFNSLM